MAMDTSAKDDGFVEEWNSLDRNDRRRIRRLARIGRPQESPDDARLGLGFVEHQRGRPWFRYFWWGFAPLVLIALFAAFMIHPIVVGIVGGLAANWVVVRRNYGRFERVNAARLGLDG